MTLVLQAETAQAPRRFFCHPHLLIVDRHHHVQEAEEHLDHELLEEHLVDLDEILPLNGVPIAANEEVVLVGLETDGAGLRGAGMAIRVNVGTGRPGLLFRWPRLCFSLS